MVKPFSRRDFLWREVRKMAKIISEPLPKDHPLRKGWIISKPYSFLLRKEPAEESQNKDSKKKESKRE